MFDADIWSNCGSEFSFKISTFARLSLRRCRITLAAVAVLLLCYSKLCKPQTYPRPDQLTLSLNLTSTCCHCQIVVSVDTVTVASLLCTLSCSGCHKHLKKEFKRAFCVWYWPPGHFCIDSRHYVCGQVLHRDKLQHCIFNKILGRFWMHHGSLCLLMLFVYIYIYNI